MTGHHFARKLAHVHIRVVVIVFVFWLVQMCAWLGMMVFVQVWDPKLGNSVLYVTQISHYALVLSCGVAATASWGLIAGRVGREDSREHQR